MHPQPSDPPERRDRHDARHRRHRDLDLMLAVERSHRAIETIDSVEPIEIEIDSWLRPRLRADSDASRRGGVPRCACCGEAGQADPRCGGVVFCPECLRRARERTEWDDLGGGG